MAVTFRIEHFEGPLDLLLQLVEQEELDISSVSLAKVAEQFVAYVNESKDIPIGELADFLVVATRLMYMKSKLLLPELNDQELEEGPDLETQLREYQRFASAAKILDKMWRAEKRSFVRSASVYRPSLEEKEFVLPPGVSLESLRLAMLRVTARLEPVTRLPQASLERVVLIQDKIRDLLHRVKKQMQTSFHSFLSGSANRTEAVVSFLALLELVKQRFVIVDQKDLFHDISIKAGSASGDPLAESFI